MSGKLECCASCSQHRTNARQPEKVKLGCQMGTGMLTCGPAPSHVAVPSRWCWAIPCPEVSLFPEPQAWCHMRSRVKGNACHHVGSSGCVPLVCLNRGPGTEMSLLETESQGGSKSREPEQSVGWSPARVKPGLASQKPMKEMGIRQKEHRTQLEDSGEKSQSRASDLSLKL